MSMTAIKECIRDLMGHTYEFVQPYQLAELMRQCKEMEVDQLILPTMM